MNTHDACNVLDIPLGSSKDDIKKAFKKKAVEFHPDRNKGDDAEKKFKEVNEAFQFLNKYGAETASNPFQGNYDHKDHFADELRRRMNESFNVNFNTGNDFNPFGTPRRSAVPSIVVSLEVPFDISVLGGRQNVTYDRWVKCEGCDDGKVSQNKTICQKCSGHGKRKYGDSDRELPCTSCGGTGYNTNSESCPSCSGTSKKRVQANLKVMVPPGVESGTRLTIKGKGNYLDKNIYGNVSVIISVVPDEEMQLNGSDVISVVELSLLEALKGTKKKLRTIRGEKTLSFKPKTKHRDTIRVQGYGVPPHGAHSFLININYPDNVDDIVNVLEQDSEEISDKD